MLLQRIVELELQNAQLQAQIVKEKLAAEQRAVAAEIESEHPGYRWDPEKGQLVPATP